MRQTGDNALACLAVCVGAFFCFVGCSASRYKAAADREAYALIAQKAKSVENMSGSFSIEQTNQWSLGGLSQRQEAVSFLGDYGRTELGAPVISIQQALSIATARSRIMQSRKEQLFLASLLLSQARHQWTPLFSASGAGRFDVDTERALDLVPDPNNPSQPKVVLSDKVVEQQKVNGGARVGSGWLIRDVGRITAAFSTDFLRFLTGDPRSLASSRLGATFTRPLLQNAGFQQEMENLTQAERDLLYEVRDFARFRKEFSVRIATAYYGVLGNRDIARNSHLNLMSSQTNAARTRALSAEGRVAQAQLGRLDQQQLSVENAWLTAVRSYRQSLDELKIQLGISVDTAIVLDDKELESLQIRHPDVAVDEAVQVALEARMDYQNSRDQYADAVRKVKISKNALKTQVDLVANVAVNSGPDSGRGFPLPDPKRYNWSAGLDVDLPFDRKRERNSYRASLIGADRAGREFSLKEDEIKQEIRDNWRLLEQARRGYEIAEIGMAVAQRRAEEQNLLAELGRANAQDQVDAQNALNEVRNQRTQALVTHTISRLQFWSNMGILYIKDQGDWEERAPQRKTDANGQSK